MNGSRDCSFALPGVASRDNHVQIIFATGSLKTNSSNGAAVAITVSKRGVNARIVPKVGSGDIGTRCVGTNRNALSRL